MEDLVAHAISRLVWTQRLVGALPGMELTAFDWSSLKQLIKQARLFLMESGWFIEIYENAKPSVGPLDAHKVEPPSVLPFECLFVTTEDAVLLFDVGEAECELVGFVLSLRGQFRAWVVLRDLKGEPVFLALYTSGQWQGSSNLGSLVVPQLATAINQQPAVVTPLSFAQRRHWRKQGRQLATYPEPFYRVRRPVTVTAPSTLPSTFTQGALRSSPSYRFDSRGHRRFLCYRGKLPLSGVDRESLEKRGYCVFLGSEVPKSWVEVMLQRGHKTPLSDEWLAMRYVPVKPSIKGDPRLPYTPSIRILH